MNLSKLFEVQQKLDERIVQEHGLQGQDLLDKKILALQVELGECANEWRGFKFWSEKQEMRRNNERFNRETESYETYDPLLEEYVDVFHFILSIGLELRMNPDDITTGNDYTGDTATETFIELYSLVSGLHTLLDVNLPASVTPDDIIEAYNELFECFVGLGELDLNFTWEQIEQTYMDKNEINHSRQDNGY